MKPRLTLRILRGLDTACAYATADLEAGADSNDTAAEELREVEHAHDWIARMFKFRDDNYYR